MKYLFIAALSICTISAQAQDKRNYVQYNRLTEITGTEYVYATFETSSKMRRHSQHLMFINTLNGETNQIDFPGDAHIESIQELKIDSIGLHVLLLAARIVNLDDDKGISYDDPKQIVVLSIDGKKRMQTADSFFSRQMIVNHQTGNMVVTGYYDTNGNKKYDKEDKNDVLLYNLKAMKQIRKE